MKKIIKKIKKKIMKKQQNKISQEKSQNQMIKAFNLLITTIQPRVLLH